MKTTFKQQYVLRLNPSEFEVIRTAIWLTRTLIQVGQLPNIVGSDWAGDALYSPEELSTRLKLIHDEMDKTLNEL